MIHWNGSEIYAVNDCKDLTTYTSTSLVSINWLHSDVDSKKGSTTGFLHKSFSLERTTTSVRKGWEKGSSDIKNFGRSLRSPFTRVFAKDLDSSKKKVLDPRSKLVQKWNKFFVVLCLVAVFVDPLFFYRPIVDGNNNCIKIDDKLAVAITACNTVSVFESARVYEESW